MASTRPAVERMISIATLLRADIAFTAGEIAARFEVNRKTIVRDLEFMRSRLGYDIRFNHARNCYESTQVPTAQL